MPQMRPPSLFPTLTYRHRPCVHGDKPAVDTPKARIKRRALELLAVSDESVTADARDLDFSALPMREGYDDSIIAAEIPPEFGVDDSWVRLDAQGMGQLPTAILQAASTAASMVGQMQAAKASEKAAQAQVKAAKQARLAAETEAKGNVEIARLQAAAGKVVKALPPWGWLAIGAGVVGIGVGAYFLFRKKK